MLDSSIFRFGLLYIATFQSKAEMCYNTQSEMCLDNFVWGGGRLGKSDQLYFFDQLCLLIKQKCPITNF